MDPMVDFVFNGFTSPGGKTGEKGKPNLTTSVDKKVLKQVLKKFPKMFRKMFSKCFHNLLHSIIGDSRTFSINEKGLNNYFSNPKPFLL